MVKKVMVRFSPSWLKARLSLDLAPPPLPRPDLLPAGVLVPLFFNRDEPHLLFTQRTLTVKDHRGQIAFPGGVRDPKDPDLLATALRESQEEIGLNPEVVEVLGALKPITTITGYAVTAYVGLIPYPYEFHPNPREVRRLLFLPVAGFCDPGRWRVGDYTYKGQSTRVCYWRHDNTTVWGATARIVLNLLALLGENPLPGDRHATCLD
jgi:8-oxo-dGTP pyrophosphatase MutT (NUDIX family)